jgi:hypothetical protein
MTERPIFMLALRPEPRVDGIRALRALLKTARRRFGLVCVTIEEVYPSAHATIAVKPPTRDRHQDCPRSAGGAPGRISPAHRNHAGTARPAQ